MTVVVPGDKSISQRALILASLGEGVSRVRAILNGGDPASTAQALRDLGSPIPPLSDDFIVRGRGLRGFSPPPGPLDLQNSGTGARLLLGVLAGQPVEAVLTGDESLRGRPMARVTEPLTAMGARFDYLEEPGRLPIRVRGGKLGDFAYNLPVASAQLKSALLLAGLVGGVNVRLVEPGRSRDHTERMLNGLGVRVDSGADPGGWAVSLQDGPDSIPAIDLLVPGDFSSAAFFLVLGLLRGGEEPLLVRNVGLNPTRTGLLPVLERMGGRVSGTDGGTGKGSGEPSGDLVVSPGTLKGCEVGGEEIPGLIDEVPILAVAAARAEGVTRITGAEELRVKETDRIKAVATNLRSVGVEAEELEDGLEIRGSDRPLSGQVEVYGDHRIAMAFGILGALPGNEIQVSDPHLASVSFPGFWDLLGRTTAPNPSGRE
jgi:3-phosphoshikimate 1-carboxyvinyltransferase